jgi:hypothetical protein
MPREVELRQKPNPVIPAKPADRGSEVTDESPTSMQREAVVTRLLRQVIEHRRGRQWKSYRQP